MTKRNQLTLGTAIAVTIAAILLWQGTGGDYYTKFQVVEEVKKEIAEDDPLASAGFYDDDVKSETVVRDEFRFGLLPTPNGILDKHLLSVASFVLPVWCLALLLLWLSRRSRLQLASSKSPATDPPNMT